MGGGDEQMVGKIALEEHFSPPSLRRYKLPWGRPDQFAGLLRRLEDFDGERLSQMDELGIEIAVLSFIAAGVQDITSTPEAIVVAREANDDLANRISRQPDRFIGFAALPMQDPEAAATELNRAVTELGFRGALVNGATLTSDGGTGAYYDAPQYGEFWAEVARLGVPFYLHPRNPLPGNAGPYDGRPELIGPTWSFAVETGTHALRLITSGLFDHSPELTLILGHLGEFLPFAIERLQQRLSHYPSVVLERSPRDVLQENFFVTTSGNYHTPSLLGTMLQMGADRILFATDYPFEQMEDTSRWFDGLPISEADRNKIGRANAASLLGLGDRVGSR
jgi:gamma-resorcylate decarboxylase